MELTIGGYHTAGSVLVRLGQSMMLTKDKFYQPFLCCNASTSDD